jgi:hypothetical protein
MPILDHHNAQRLTKVLTQILTLDPDKRENAINGFNTALGRLNLHPTDLKIARVDNDAFDNLNILLDRFREQRDEALADCKTPQIKNDRLAAENKRLKLKVAELEARATQEILRTDPTEIEVLRARTAAYETTLQRIAELATA